MAGRDAHTHFSPWARLSPPCRLSAATMNSPWPRWLSVTGRSGSARSGAWSSTAMVSPVGEARPGIAQGQRADLDLLRSVSRRARLRAGRRRAGRARVGHRDADADPGCHQVVRGVSWYTGIRAARPAVTEPDGPRRAWLGGI